MNIISVNGIISLAKQKLIMFLYDEKSSFLLKGKSVLLKRYINLGDTFNQKCGALTWDRRRSWKLSNCIREKSDRQAGLDYPRQAKVASWQCPWPCIDLSWVRREERCFPEESGSTVENIKISVRTAVCTVLDHIFWQCLTLRPYITI